MHIENVKDHFLVCQSTLFHRLLQSLVLPAAPNDFPNETAVFMELSHAVMSGLQNVQCVHKFLPVTNSKKSSKHFCLVWISSYPWKLMFDRQLTLLYLSLAERSTDKLQ